MADNFKELVYNRTVKVDGWKEVEAQIGDSILKAVWRSIRNPVTRGAWGSIGIHVSRQMREDTDD